MQHHFGTRQRLIGATVERWGERMVSGAQAPAVAGLDERARAHALLGMLWDFHAEPPGPAVFELLYAGRHDAQVAAQVASGMDSLWGLVIQVARDLTPSYASRVGYEDHLRLVIAGMRGTVMLAPLDVATAGLTRGRFLDLALASFEALPETGSS